jgi:hypothetical protein
MTLRSKRFPAVVLAVIALLSLIAAAFFVVDALILLGVL